MLRWLARAAFAAVLLACSVTGGAVRADEPAASRIAVAGNRHTDPAMIRSYFHVMPGKPLDAAALDAALKALYATGLFGDVKITPQGAGVLVTVVENPTVVQIAFEGNKKVKDAELKKDLQSKEGGPLSRFFVQADVEHMTEVYRQHGYFQVQITPQTIAVKGAEHAKGERVNLVFQIKEGDKLAVRKIAFAGNRAFPDYKLTGVIKTGKTNILSFLLDNDIYNADKIENDCDLLRGFYRDHGYADIRVRSSASYDAESKGVVVTYTLDEGPLYRFGKVAIETQLKAVDAASMRPYLRMQSGDIYDADAVRKTIDDLTMALARQGQPFASAEARMTREPPSPGGTGVIDLVYTIDAGQTPLCRAHSDPRQHQDAGRRHPPRIRFRRRRCLQPRAGRSRRAAAEGARLFQVGQDRDRARLGARSRRAQRQRTGAGHRKFLHLRRLFHLDRPDGECHRQRQQSPGHRI